MKIRKFILDDLQRIIEFSIKAYEIIEEKKIKEFAKGFTNYTLDKYISEPEGLLIAEENGKIIGNCFGHVDEKDKEIGYLWYIAIDPNFQGKGTGSELLACLTNYFKTKGIKKIKLGTDRSKAVSFYEKHGFKIIHWLFEKDI